MKRDWTKPQMRLSPRDIANDFFSFLLFLRLGFVTFLCFPGALVILKRYGPAVGTLACLLAFPLWWYHFGPPRFKDGIKGFNFFSPEFCLWGYVLMTALLVLDILELFGILKEAPR